MNTLTKFAIAAASAVGLALTPIAAVSAQEYNAYGASCTVGATSTFTAVKRGFYAWTWRTGSTVNGGGVKYLSAGQSWTPTTPGAADSTTRFGVLTTSKTFAYVTCSLTPPA